jgi:ketosteroid isomerase-like protein
MDEIRNLLAEKAAATQAGDVDRIVAQYAPDVVKFDLAPPLVNQAPRDATGLKAWFATFHGPVGYEIRDLDITASEDLAYCHSLNRLSATPLGTTQQFDLWFRMTVCLRKLDGTWRITHEHQSTPFYMDGSMRAATDLKP